MKYLLSSSSNGSASSEPGTTPVSGRSGAKTVKLLCPPPAASITRLSSNGIGTSPRPACTFTYSPTPSRFSTQ
ncbi:hypothetical protein BBK82_35540 [Lentzea guizhouensis]|uniref:Uncharacterized protein n=1 Tax=Lentzea guizhouensis TaxID=1586287 RepID=A0A1B2HS47_9PSEU|nr:hypothetical protein BBK82_35540 [Lentzea guizhouensis]